MTDLVSELSQSDEYIDSFSRFDYDHLDAETRTLAQLRAKKIKNLMKQTAQNIIEIGRKLIEIKVCLGHGHFGNWLRAEFEWGIATAARFMQVAASFGSDRSDQIYQIDKFAPSALYLLAAPSTPDSARSIALERAQSGDRITHKVALQIVAEVKKADNKKLKLAHAEATEPAPMEKEPNTIPLTDRMPATLDAQQGEENASNLGDSGPAILAAALPMSDNSPDCNLISDALIFTCGWHRDKYGNLTYRVEINDSNIGRKIESIAKERGMLPKMVIPLGIEALEIMPEKERRITELILQVRSFVEQASSNCSEMEKLKQTVAQQSAKIQELVQALAQKNSEEAEPIVPIALAPSRSIAQNDSRETELVQALEQKDSQLEEMKEQLAASEYYSAQAALELEQLKKELAQAQQQQQQPKTLPSGKPQPIPRTSTNPAPNLKSLIDFFDTAAEKLQKPSIQISMNGKTLVVSRNSTQHPGALNIKAGGAWQGRIEQDGSLYKIWQWDDWIMPMLLAFAANPTEMAAQHGRSTGSCCFCNRALKDERSLATGYGAICAQHYGLQWPLETKLSQDDDRAQTDPRSLDIERVEPAISA